MTRSNETAGRTAILTPDPAPAEAVPDRPVESLSIFSGPGLEVVFQWWLESNRRWTERDRAKN
ncbi:MAG TPA: hypothetical protein VH679_03580 [Vicinamibacterales bacterium]|jgi:hypothetical protein